MDRTEGLRRILVEAINDVALERKALEERYGQVWDTEQLRVDFDVRGFAAPFVAVIRKSDKKKGAMTFQHSPRYYWDFEEIDS